MLSIGMLWQVSLYLEYKDEVASRSEYSRHA